MTGSNRLPVLAAEIRKAHADVQEAAKTAAQRAIDAGKALIEAKELVKHGEWLPWLREHCALGERTAQLYMKIAKSGNGPELIAAIGLQGAAQVIQTIIDPSYDMWANCDEEGKRDWHIFMLFLVSERSWYPEGAACHIEWILQRCFTTPSEWLGDVGSRWRRRSGLHDPSPGLIADWQTFLGHHRHRTVEDLDAELNRFHKERGSQPPPSLPKSRRRKSATVAYFEAAS